MGFQRRGRRECVSLVSGGATFSGVFSAFRLFLAMIIIAVTAVSLSNSFKIEEKTVLTRLEMPIAVATEKNTAQIKTNELSKKIIDFSKTMLLPAKAYATTRASKTPRKINAEWVELEIKESTHHDVKEVFIEKKSWVDKELEAEKTASELDSNRTDEHIDSFDYGKSEAEEWEKIEAETAALSRSLDAYKKSFKKHKAVDNVAQKNIKLALLTPPPVSNFYKKLPWQHYAVGVSEEINNRPMIAIVIDDLGVDKRRTRKILNLPAPITASFLSYAQDISKQAQKARKAGHELLLHVPMEPKGKKYDPGPMVLKTSMSKKKLLKTLDVILGSFNGYVGINNHMGSKFTGNKKSMRIVMKELKKRGLLFLDSRTTSKSVCPDLAISEKVPHAMRHIFLDNFPGVKTVKRQLKKLERIARRDGFAVGIGHPRDGTVEALKQWLPTLKEKGFILVPLTSIVDYKMLANSKH